MGAMDAQIVAILKAMAEQLDRIEARGSPEQWRRAFDDLMYTYGLTGQIAEVVHQQRDHLQAFGEAMVRFHALLSAHDARLIGAADASAQEREELRGLLIQLRELIRLQVAKTDNIERELGMSADQRARLGRDVRHEEGPDR